MCRKNAAVKQRKLLIDAVQSAKFITTRKSRELIKKLERHVSRYQAEQLHRQVFIAGRVKSMNESIYYNIDKLHEAINTGVQIRFQYGQWNVNKTIELRRDGAWYQVSPWALTWDDENYYLIGFDAEDDKIKHYRVDKMRDIELTDEKREGKEHFKQFDMAAYARMNFGMFGGEEVRVNLHFRNEMVGVLLDRFGKDISIYKTDKEGWSETYVDVALSDQFLGWIFSLGTKVKIVGPEEVVKKFKDELKNMSKLYG